MPDHSLLMLFDEVRRKTLRVLHDVSDEQAAWIPPGLQNSILWHAGHSFVVVESLVMRAVDREPDYPENWFEVFKWKGEPGNVPPELWPTLTEVTAQLRAQPDRLRPMIESLSEEQLAGPVPEKPAPEKPERTVRFYIIHGLRDEACHAGEIWLLRKIQDRIT